MSHEQGFELRPVAVVTGGSRGIGRAIAIEAARRGFDTVFTYRDEVSAAETLEIARAAGLLVRGVRLHLDDREAVAAFGAGLADHGRASLLVNNAGMIRAGALSTVSDADWDATVATNLTAPFLLSRALERSLRANRGAIVNISSNGGVSGSMLGTPYGATKSGVLGLTWTLARELAPDVRVNAIAPGSTATDMYANIDEAERRAFESAIPLQRVAQPEEIGRVVLDVAQWGYVTGQTIVVDGGVIMR